MPSPHDGVEQRNKERVGKRYLDEGRLLYRPQEIYTRRELHIFSDGKLKVVRIFGQNIYSANDSVLVYPTTHSNRLAEYEKEDRTLVDYYALAPVPTDYSVAAGEKQASKIYHEMRRILTMWHTRLEESLQTETRV